MPAAARVGDATSHQGLIGGPGAPTVLIGGMPAANAGTPHVGAACSSKEKKAPCEPVFLTPTAVPTVLIGGMPALVKGSTVAPPCGATVLGGAPTVLIGG